MPSLNLCLFQPSKIPPSVPFPTLSSLTRVSRSLPHLKGGEVTKSSTFLTRVPVPSAQRDEGLRLFFYILESTAVFRFFPLPGKTFVCESIRYPLTFLPPVEAS